MALLVSDILLPEEESAWKRAVADRLGVKPGRVRALVLVRKSLDARHKNQRWRAVFRVEVEGEDAVLARPPGGVSRWTARHEGRYGLDDQAPERRSFGPDFQPIVVGAGPAGLFAALYLAECGAKVRLLERGAPTEERVPAVNGHWQGRIPLDPENNILFGEGGAGTFSDGKIYTRRRDGEPGFIFRRLIDFGADEGAIQEAWAHLGTDRIRAILPVFRRRLQELGVEVHFHARVDDLIVEDGVVCGVKLADGRALHGGPVLIGPGHSARDTVAMLVGHGAAAEARPIAIGARIEHPQTVIDAARYGGARDELPPASYRLAFNPENDRHAHTFCMCPGGMVVPASAQPGRVVVNGMSFAARRAFWANSAVIVEVRPEDYGGEGPLAGYAFQDKIEKACFERSGNTERAPAQRVSDLLAGRPSVDLPRVSYPLGAVPCGLREVLPDFIVEGMKRAVLAFEKEVPGFAGADAVLIAPETRTTSPVRFHRTEDGEAIGLKGLFPIGEGAGHGGGIVSCALDGLRVGRSLAARHASPVDVACG